MDELEKQAKEFLLARSRDEGYKSQSEAKALEFIALLVCRLADRDAAICKKDEALRGFARAAEGFDPRRSDEEVIAGFAYASSPQPAKAITLGHLRIAKAALSPSARCQHAGEVEALGPDIPCAECGGKLFWGGPTRAVCPRCVLQRIAALERQLDEANGRAKAMAMVVEAAREYRTAINEPIWNSHKTMIPELGDKLDAALAREQRTQGKPPPEGTGNG